MARCFVVSTGSRRQPSPLPKATTHCPSWSYTLSMCWSLLMRAIILPILTYRSSQDSARPGAANPLAGHPYILLRDAYPNIVAKAGVAAPAGTSPYKFMGAARANHTPDCQKVVGAVTAQAASAARGDANGKASFPGVGTCRCRRSRARTR